MQLLCGELNKNLKQIEKALKIKVSQNGTEFDLSGRKSDVGIAVSALLDLKEKIELNTSITPDLVHLSLHTAKFSDDADLKNLAQIKTPRVNVAARGKNQKEYIQNIQNSDLTFGVGPSGTGKTFLAVACAVDDLLKEKIRKIVLVRPAVRLEKDLVFYLGISAPK